MQNGLSPDYLTSLVPATVGSTSSYPLRNASNLQTIHANSQVYYNSFLPSVVRDWNELPEQTRNSPSLNSFKKSINVNISTPPRYYNTGNVLRPTPGDPWGVGQHHWNTGAEENQQLNPGGPSNRQLK